MKRISLILIFLGTIRFVFGQQDSALNIALLRNVSGLYTNFTTDHLGNLYLLTAGNQIKKLNEKGDSVAVYNDVKRYGNIYSIDASNPLKVLVYYKDFATIIVLDRLLNMRTAIELRRQNILQVTAVTSSYDNRIWLYDEVENKLKKIDDKGNIVLESADFRQIFNPAPAPAQMYDRDGQLYLYDQAKGLMVFDYYAGYKNNFQILHLSDLQVIDKNTITARNNDKILLYKPATLQSFMFRAFDAKAAYVKIQFNGSKIYCLTKNGSIEIYTLR